METKTTHQKPKRSFFLKPILVKRFVIATREVMNMYTKFMDWNSRWSKNKSSVNKVYRCKVISVKTSARIVFRDRKQYSKINVEKKKNNFGGGKEGIE